MDRGDASPPLLQSIAQSLTAKERARVCPSADCVQGVLIVADVSVPQSVLSCHAWAWLCGIESGQEHGFHGAYRSLTGRVHAPCFLKQRPHVFFHHSPIPSAVQQNASPGAGRQAPRVNRAASRRYSHQAGRFRKRRSAPPLHLLLGRLVLEHLVHHFSIISTRCSIM